MTEEKTVLETVIVTVSKEVKIVEGKVTKALEFEGKNLMCKIEPKDDDTCVSDLMKCKDTGFTVSLKVKLIDVKKDCFIVSTGGEREDSYGVAFKFVSELNVYKALVTTDDKQWILTVEADKIVEKEWITLDLSFREDTGVAVYVDSELIAREVKYEKREVKVEKSMTSSIFIAHSSVTTRVEETCQLAVETVSFFSATRESLVRADVVEESKLTFYYH